MNRSFVGAAALAGLLACNAATASATPTEPPSDVGEVKGLAWDAGKDRLWIAGDQADAGTVVGAMDGTDPVTITFHVDIQSVQGLAMANGALYVGDIGDENGQREFVTIYRFADTGPSSDKKFFAYDLAYPNEEKLHATALMVAADGTFYVATAGDDAGLFVASSPSRTEVNVMERVADAPAGVTDAVMLDDDLTAALLSEEGITLVDTLTGETVGAGERPEGAKSTAVAVLDPSTLILADDASIQETSIPQVEETAEPEPSETTSESAESVVEEAVEEVATPNNSGTIVALALAVIVSLGAAIATYVVRA